MTRSRDKVRVYCVRMAPLTHRRSLLHRLTFDRDGRLRGWRVLTVAAAAAMVLTFGGLTAAILAGSGTPEALAVWATVAFFAIKLPLLSVLWWLLGRSEHTQEDELLPDATAAAAIQRLRGAAERASGLPDEWDRLDTLAAEAAYVAARAQPDIAGDAQLLRVDLINQRDKVGRAA